MKNFLFLPALLLLLCNCAKNPEEVVAEWEEQGWSKVWTHGVVKESVRQGKLSSERAQSIEVSWIERGKRKT